MSTACQKQYSLLVNPAVPTISLSASLTTTFLGQNITLTATISPPVAGHSIHWSFSNAGFTYLLPLANGTTNSSGVASITTPLLGFPGNTLGAGGFGGPVVGSTLQANASDTTYLISTTLTGLIAQDRLTASCAAWATYVNAHSGDHLSGSFSGTAFSGGVTTPDYLDTGDNLYGIGYLVASGGFPSLTYSLSFAYIKSDGNRDIKGTYSLFANSLGYPSPPATFIVS